MTLLTVKPGDTKKLPPNAAVFVAGLGWDPAAGQSESPDLDLWVLRHHNTGLVEVIAWPNEDWHAPKLGKTAKGNPYIATPERDVIHQGDDRTGEQSATGYDETAQFDLSKTPDTVVKYSIFGTIYDEDGAGLTLGMASNVTFGVKDEVSGNELKTDPASDHGFDVSVALATIDKGPDGKWSLTAVAEDKRGTTDDMITIAKSFGAQFKN